ncbi:MAG: HK97 family phage prohead protease [Actinomycetota bacterium]|nr:HK97 family phage prohead protease [Actinomycetota bacterium]
MAEMSTSDINDLKDDQFGYVEPGGTKDSSGKTTPRSLRHFPIHDAAHVRNALARAPQSPFGDKAMPAIKKAADRLGIDVGDDGRSMLDRVPVERRYTRSPVECRAETSGKRITGYGAVFHTAARPVMSRNLGGFIERVMPSAFNQARHAGWPGAVARYNHDENMLLGTIAGGTLSLSVDNVGLGYDVLPPQSRADILELVGRGDVQHSSFAFRVPSGGEEWSLSEQNYPMRSLTDVQLVDVAPVVSPAYPDATAALRSLAESMGTDETEVRSMADKDELRRFFARTDRSSLPAGVRPKPKPEKKRTLGAAALADLMGKREDPWGDLG